MPAIEKDLVHVIQRGQCANCHRLKEDHAHGACLFDFTEYREESLNDHLDCSCERVITEDTKIDGSAVHVDMTIRHKKPISWMGLTFTV